MATDTATRSVVPPQGGYFAKKPTCAVQNEFDPGVDSTLKVAPSAAAQHRMNEGIEFETAVEETLLASIYGSKTSSKAKVAYKKLAAHPNVAHVRWDRDGTLAAVFLAGERTVESKAGREQATLTAMDLGVRFIWNARLPAGNGEKVGPRISEPDFLVRGADRSDGRPGYLPGDVKHHKALDGTSQPKPWTLVPFDMLDVEAGVPSTELGAGSPRRDDALQLAHYYRHLEELGYEVETTQRQGLLIGKEPFALVHELDATLFDRGKRSAMELYDEQFAARLFIAEDLVEGGRASLPMTKRTECGECDWRVYCDTWRKTRQDVSRVKGVTREQAEIHAGFGMTTVSDLARLDVPTAMVVDAGLATEELIELARDINPAMDAYSVLRLAGDHPDSTKTQRDRQDTLVDTLAACGVTTAADLAGLCPVTARYAGTRVQRLADQIDRARVLINGKAHLARGRDQVSIPRATIELHVDIEDNGGFVYLIGVKTFGRKDTKDRTRDRRRFEYHGFVTWETTSEAEARVIAEWWQYMQAMQAYARVNKWGVKAYCYTKHERSSLLKKAAEHADVAFDDTDLAVPSVAELRAFFDSADWVDIHAILEHDVVLPAEDVTLKTVATKVCGHVWADEDPSGGNSMAWYDDAVNHTDPAVRTAERERLLTYNDDDCHATYAVAEWFTKHGQARKPGSLLPSVSALDPYFRALRHVA